MIDFQSFQILQQSSDLVLYMPGKIYACKYETEQDIVVPIPPKVRLHLTPVVTQIDVAQMDRDHIR